MKYINTEDYDHQSTEKTGVLLVNLGTPSAPTAAAVKPYLKQFLSDPRVVEIPRLVWWTILNGIILPFRSKRSAEAYQSIWTENGSPLLVNTKKIAEKMQQNVTETQPNLVIDFAMCYGQPSMSEKLEQFIAQGVKKLLVLPLYPQYSATTTGATFDGISSLFMKRRWFPELRFVNHYHDHPQYIEALANKITQYREQHGTADRLVLSFHGIPKRFWLSGDPYVCECFKTARLLAERLGLGADEIMTCFQSRFGKAEWVQPYLDATLKALPSQGVQSVQVFCPGFAADCLETLEEIAEENKEYFLEAGGERFEYIPCLNDDDEHIEFIQKLVAQHTTGWLGDVESDVNRQQRVTQKQQELDRL